MQTSPGARRSRGALSPWFNPALSSGTLWHFVPWQGHCGEGTGWQGVAGATSTGFQCTSAGLQNNELQQGLLLMVKNTEAK